MALNNVVIDQWKSFSSNEEPFTVLPDGCRDLILKVSAEQSHHWFVSPCFHQATEVISNAGSLSTGFRLAPGSVINEKSLIAELKEPYCDELTIMELIAEFTSVSENTYEALQCLGKNPISVGSAAKKLGVHSRTLQRHISTETGLTPSYWVRLSRIRTAGRLIALGYPLVDVAATAGYSDQAHLSRECSHWFKVPPTTLQSRRDLSDQLFSVAFS